MQPGDPSPLISVDELATVLMDVTVLDVRWQLGGPPGEPEFLAGHIPGASYVDLGSALASAPGPRGRHPLPSVEVFEAAMRAVGVCSGRPVVAYDDWAGRAAARCWWLLRWAGHSDVRVLDGGLAGWIGAGGEVSTGSVAAEPGDFTARPGQLPVLSVEEVLDFADRGLLLDAREPARFRGEVEPIDPVAGHIPGAVNIPTGANLTDDGRFRSAEELRSVYAPAAGREVAAYCGSGVTAAHDLLALAVIGIDGTLYPGSWSEWITDDQRPVATG